MVPIDKRVQEQLERAGYFGQNGYDLITKFLYWLWPPLKKERDLLIDKLQDYRQALSHAEDLAIKMAFEAQKRETEVSALKQPEQPRLHKAMTAAEIRRMTEREFAMEEQDGV